MHLLLCLSVVVSFRDIVSVLAFLCLYTCSCHFTFSSLPSSLSLTRLLFAPPSLNPFPPLPSPLPPRRLPSDLDSYRLETAKSLGADHTIQVKTRDSHELSRIITGQLNSEPDQTIECSGAEASIATAIYVSFHRETPLIRK